MACMVVQCFQKSILSRVTTKSLSRPRTSQKQQSLHHFSYLNICSHLLGCLVPHKCFKEWWMAPQIVWKVCLHTWTTHEPVLRTAKHTSAIWRLFFSLLWPPMVSPWTLKNVFSQHLLWNSWTHTFGDRSSPHGLSRRRNWKLPTPSGYQTTSMVSRWWYSANSTNRSGAPDLQHQ